MGAFSFLRKAAVSTVAIAAGTVATVTGLPSLTQRRFHDEAIPPPQQELPRTREECLEQLIKANSPAAAMDVLVIGGGATGAGIALDAATRGLKTGLVEANDYAAGTSCRSTKLIHGGVRYLERAVLKLELQQFKLVFEALKERAVMIHQAPHLCAPLATMLPCYSPIDVPKYWFGLKLYDVIAAAGLGTLLPSGFLSRKKTLAAFPGMTAHQGAQRLWGSIVYYDGQMDDARLNLAVALTATCYGANCVNHCRCDGLLYDEAKTTVNAARVHDALSGKTYTVYAKCIINAGGPFADSVDRLHDPSRKNMIAPSKGVHITLPASYSPSEHGVIIPKTSDGRVIFVLPWNGLTIAGTTDTPTKDITEDPRVQEEDVQYILDSIHRYYDHPVRRQDVLSAWAGIRPLAKDPDADPKETKAIVREHFIKVNKNHVVSVSGGKWTTYRKIAQDVLDAAIEKVPTLKSFSTRSCVTDRLRLFGAMHMKSFVPPIVENNSVEYHLHHSYGDQIARVRSVVEENPVFAQRIVSPVPVLKGEVVYAVRQEHARSVSDFISRRTRMSFLNVNATREAIPIIGDLMAKELHWSASEKQQQIDNANRHLDAFVPAPLKE